MASPSSEVASERLSAAVANTFWPTMTTERRTSWRNVWKIHETTSTARCEQTAAGSPTMINAARP
ncbi:MAG: hypothetical protein ABSF84_01115 [Acidimicrobiales bacterium]